MIKLRVEELNEFFKVSNSIRNTTTMPELDYLYLQRDSIGKTNLGMYCKMNLEVVSDNDEFPMLIDENVLKTLLKTTFKTEVEITVNKKDNKVRLSDGKNHFSYSWYDPKLYPKTPEPNNNTSAPVSKSIIDTIKIALNFISESDNATNFQFVHFKDNYIFAVDFHKFYVKKFNFKFPEASLYVDYCNVITQFNSASFSQNDKFYFYKFGSNLIFAFLKYDYTIPDIIPRVEILKKVTEQQFTISKKDVVNFCDSVNTLTPSKQIICSFREDPVLGACLESFDIDYSKEHKKEILVGGILPDFSFNSRTCYNALKSLTQEEFNCVVEKHTLVISDNDSWACFSGTQDVARYGDSATQKQTENV